MHPHPTALQFWIAFNLGVLGLVALDLGVFHRRPRALEMREAGFWSVVWVSLSLLFNAVIWQWKGSAPAADFFLGFVMEKSLSMDNLFVFVLIFTYFQVPAQYQRRVLSLGIVGALVMRGAFIFLGAEVLARFRWMSYVFGGFLVYSGIKMLFHENEEVDPAANPAVKLFSRFFPVVTEYHGSQFFVRHQGALAATPLFIVLLVVETSDILFAVDSIPAIFGVTRDPFIIYTSNVCAILGLRALYFMLASMMTEFRFLKHGISVVLAFIGAKMLAEEFYPIRSEVSLAVVATVLGVTALASMLFRLPAKKD